MAFNKDMKIGALLVVTGLLGLFVTQGACMRPGMMGNGRHMNGMMGNSAKMKEMMQQNMANQLPPPGLKQEHLPESDSFGAKLLVRYCTQCHDLPAPGLHALDEWPAVVERMNKRMQTMGNQGMMQDIRSPSASELQSILSYLQKHAL